MPRRSLTILCAGAYGIRNAGDDLPLLCLMESMRTFLPTADLRFRALSRHPDPWEEERYGVTMVKNLEYDTAEEARGRKFMGFNEGDDPAHLERIKGEIAACDLLVLGAGNALIDLTIGDMRGPIPLMALYGSLASQARKPVMLYGMSVGPLRTPLGRHLTEGLLRTASVITVRDLDSARLCRTLLGGRPTKPGDRMPYIHVLPDATLGAESPGPLRAREVFAQEGMMPLPDRPLIALGLRDLARPVSPEAQRRLEDGILGMMAAMKHEAAFLFIPQSTYLTDDDRILARTLAAAAPAGVQCRVIEQRHHPLDLIALYGAARATLAVRLHAAVFSAIAGTPFGAISYLPKVTGFLEQAGCTEAGIGPWDVTPESLTALMRSRLEATAEERFDLGERVRELRKRTPLYALLALTKGVRANIGGGSDREGEE